MEFLYIGFGWLLGFLGTFIVDTFRNKQRAKRLTKTVLHELHDLQIRFVLLYYMIGQKRGSIDRRAFDWIHEIIMGYDGPVVEQEFKDLLAKMASYNDKDLAIGLSSAIRPVENRSAVKRYSLPTLRSELSTLVYLNQETVRQLTEILNRLDTYNEIVDEYRLFFNKTFDSAISPENYQILSQNLTKNENMLVFTARNMAERIEKVRNAMQNKHTNL